MRGESLPSVLHRVAGRTVAYSFKCWGFGESIAMLGLLAASRVSGDRAPREAVEALFTRWHGSRGDALPFADHVTPGVPLLMLSRGDARWLRPALALGTLFRTFPQQRGVCLHRPDLDGWSSHAWVDCLYTDGAFLTLLGRMTGDRSWEDLACAHTLAYVHALWNPTSGLFCHGYDAATGRANAVHWGRGNGWALLGLIDLLRLLRGDHPARPDLAAIVRRQVDALLVLQDASGHWHTVLDHPDTYLETSVAAMMAWAFPAAVRLGLAPNTAEATGERALDAVLAAVDASGGLTGVSEATPAGDLATYATRPTGIYPWGQGPLLLALADRIVPDRLWEGLA